MRTLKTFNFCNSNFSLGKYASQQALTLIDWKVREGCYKKNMPVCFPVTAKQAARLLLKLEKFHFKVRDQIIWSIAYFLNGGSGSLAEFTYCIE